MKSLNIRNVDKDLMQALKIEAAKRGLTMRGFVMFVLRSWLRLEDPNLAEIKYRDARAEQAEKLAGGTD